MGTRTTLTLDDDVAAAINREVRRSGRPTKTVVNDALRVGLERGERRPREPFRVDAIDLGLREGIELDDISGLFEQIEGPRHR